MEFSGFLGGSVRHRGGTTRRGRARCVGDACARSLKCGFRVHAQAAGWRKCFKADRAVAEHAEFAYLEQTATAV